jgi:hypothetical protein
MSTNSVYVRDKPLEYFFLVLTASDTHSAIGLPNFQRWKHKGQKVLT